MEKIFACMVQGPVLQFSRVFMHDITAFHESKLDH